MSEPHLEVKRAQALELLRGLDGVVVALSGGVDSAVLLALAAQAQEAGRVLAATGLSASVSEDEARDAAAVAAYLGVRHQVVNTYELDNPSYRANAGDRCYHCRTELFGVLRRLARERGLQAVAYGAIADDLGDVRPGMTAAAEQDAVAPLLEAGFTKEDVYAVARDLGLPVSGKPASACLSSRIPVGTEVTPERLAQVGQAEAGLRRLGLRQLRVRHHGEVARLELDPEGEARLADPGVRARAVAVVRDAGFRFVALDLEGYRTGSLNLVQIDPARDGGQ